MQHAKADETLAPRHIKYLAWNVLESMDESLVVTNQDGYISYLNHAAEKLLETTFTRAFGHRIDALLHPSPLGRSGMRDHAALRAVSKEFNPESLNGLCNIGLRHGTQCVNINKTEVTDSGSGKLGFVFVLRSLPTTSNMVKPPSVHDSHCMTATPEYFHEKLRRSVSMSTSRKHPQNLLFLHLDSLYDDEFDRRGSARTQFPADKVVDIIKPQLPKNSIFCQLRERDLVLLLRDTKTSHATYIALDLINTVRQHFQAADNPHQIGLSVGIFALSTPLPSIDTDLLIQAAEYVCNEARSLGDNALQIYEHRRGDSVKHSDVGHYRSRGLPG
ncbi:diguanylate cyclase domain-containing protein [Marinobacter caseinilyticus]|uniref:diguanylate cyclase domain-containing protein n=1 Tax=Marinobacter caseinilyticus TaxID=2692195 RepID=UPI00140C6A72|nr:diguanylate cyclase [Marinobacter caseinilyticus]